jgi:hypothetical protein
MSRHTLACGEVIGFKKPHAIALWLIDPRTNTDFPQNEN